MPPKTRAASKNLKSVKKNTDINKNFSFRVLDSKKATSPKTIENKLAVYEFTFDPNEEPPPQKKKRKRVIRKKVAQKPKVVFVNNNYDANISKTIQHLRNVVKTSGNQIKAISSANNANSAQVSGSYANKCLENNLTNKEVLNVNPCQKITVVSPDKNTINIQSNQMQDFVENEVHFGFDDHLDYSPVASPNQRAQVKMSEINETRDALRKTRARSVMQSENFALDPLNLLGETSFFNEAPAASSSFNSSVRNPNASPWRVEFSNLPIKWQPNTYIKSNMTPAVESSFVGLNDNKKKHVYTNIVPQSNNSLQEMISNDDTTKLKQTSIISFFREMAEKSENKNKRKSLTPTKTKVTQNELDTPEVINKTPHKALNESINRISNRNLLPLSNSTPESAAPITTNNQTSGNIRTPLKHKHNDSNTVTPAKTTCINIDNTENYFGFDDSENRENSSPKKRNNHKIRALRPRARAVLREINANSGPCRAKLPLASKIKFAPNSEIVQKVFNDMKVLDKDPVIPKTVEKNLENTNDSDPSLHESREEDNEQAQSLHLFEDIDVIHSKPPRKSYGKGKKVTFCQNNASDSDSQESKAQASNSELSEDDNEDVTFRMPTIRMKKVTKKKKGTKLTKKEEEEVEAWAAAFNSMCEDVEEFPLLLE